ncbi:MAG: cytidine deaminase [Candidatus Hydrogenedentes bacterium]|nr:cytidine deaminase [Candidatus Hydrogenedentota bacterium]
MTKAAQNAAVNYRPNDDVHIGGVGSALRTFDGGIFTGACIDCGCGIGFCAEHSAIAEMLKHRVTRIAAIVAVNWRGEILPPCGRCRELMQQIDGGNRETQILIASGTVVSLSELLPFPWRTESG